MKLQISLDDKLVDRIDRYAEDNYMSRSGLISFATSQYLNQNELMGLIKDMSLAMHKIAESGSLDDNSIKQLDDFERTLKLLTAKQ